jgi:hypothetical protein
MVQLDGYCLVATQTVIVADKEGARDHMLSALLRPEVRSCP